MAEKEDEIPKHGDDDKELHAQAIKRYDLASEAVYDERQEQIDDLNFLAGDQWDAEIVKQREDDLRPMLTLNILPTYIDQVVGDMRQNKMSIKIRAMDDDSDEEGAKIREGLIRNIEYSSKADRIYLQAGISVVQMGFGAWRANTRKVHEGTFNQEIYLEGIANPHSVLLDPDAVQDDGSDAQYGFIFDSMSQAEFEHRYPDKMTSPLEDAPGTEQKRWYDQDSIVVAEYYYIRIEKPRYLLEMSDGQEVFEDEMIEEFGDEWEVAIQVLDNPITVVKREEIEIKRVYYCKMSGAEILEGPTKWVGSMIPIVPVYGKRINIEGKQTTRGLTRNAKDPCKMYNYQQTAIAELFALQPKVPYIATDEQISGNPEEWGNANLGKLSVLRYKGDPAANGPPQRVQPPQVSASMFQAALTSLDDIKRATGIYDASMGAQSNETSGRAILARQREGDNANFAFQDQLAMSVVQTGKIILDMIPDVYDSPRTIRTMNADETTDMVPINQEAMREVEDKDEIIAYTAWMSGQDVMNIPPDQLPGMWLSDPNGKQAWEQSVQMSMEKYEIDLKRGRHDVVVTVGPAYASARIESVNTILEYLKVDPAFVEVARDIVLKNMDFEDSDELAERAQQMNQMPPPIEGQAGQARPSQQAGAPRPALSARENRS